MSVLCLPWTPLPSLPQPLIERWLLCWPQCLKRQLLPHHRFNVVLTRFTLWGKRDTASGEAGLTAVVTAFRVGGQAPRGRCNLSTKVYTAMSISDFSASQLRWLPILELRKEKLLGTESKQTVWTAIWQSQNSQPLRLTLNPGPLNLDLQPLRRDTEQGPGVASPVGSGRFLGLQDCWFPHAGISVTNKCLKYKPHLDTRVWNRIRETIRTWKRQAQTLRKPVSLGTVELWAKCIYTEPGTAVRALSDLLSIHYNLNKSYYYSTTRTEEETKTKKGSQQGCEPRKPGPESTSFTLCCGDLPPGGSPGETFLLHQPPNVFPRTLWLLQGAV